MSARDSSPRMARRIQADGRLAPVDECHGLAHVAVPERGRLARISRGGQDAHAPVTPHAHDGRGHGTRRQAMVCWAAVLLLASTAVGWGATAGLPSSAGSTVGQANRGPREPTPFVPRGAPLGEMASPLEDSLRPLVPKQPTSEAQEDHLHALALFATGRALEQRDEPAKALRYYQRALRYDPRAKAAARAAVVLADQLERAEVRDRYLLLAAELEPDLVDAIDLVGLADRATDDAAHRRAIALLEKTSIAAGSGKAKSPSDVAVRWTLAEAYAAQGQPQKAADHVEAVLGAAEHPERFGLEETDARKWFGPGEYRALAEVMLQAGRLDRAEEAFRRADQLAKSPPARTNSSTPTGTEASKPAEPPVVTAGMLDFDLARVALARGKPQEALPHVEACLAAQPTALGLAPCELLAEVLDALGKKSELLQRLARLADASPPNGPAVLFLARHDRQAGQVEKAVPLLERLLAKEPVVEGYRALFDIYRQQGKIDEMVRTAGEVAKRAGSLDPLAEEISALADGPAAKFFPQALDRLPEVEIDLLTLWSQGLLAAEKYAEAADVLRRGRDSTKATDQERAAFAYHLGGVLEMLGKTDEALATAAAAGKLERLLPTAQARKAWILHHARREAEAAGAYAELVNRYDADYRTPGVREIVRQARLVLAGIHVARGEPKPAEELLEEVLDEFPDDVSAMNDLGYLWADRKVHLERALRMVRRAVEAEPEVAAYRDSLGWALFRLGRLEEAAVELEKAAAVEPSEGELLEHLGEVRAAQGQTDKAQTARRQAAAAYQKAGLADRAEAVRKKLPASAKP